MKMNLPPSVQASFAALLTLLAVVVVSYARHRQSGNADSQAQNRPWMNSSLSSDERADLVLKEMTLDEKIDLLHGNGMPGWSKPRPNAHLAHGGARFVPGVARLV